MSRKRSHSEVSSGSSTTTENGDGASDSNLTITTSFIDSIGTDMVNIYVGYDGLDWDEKLFRVHRKLICRQCPYFANIFEGRRKTARLPYDSPELFDVLLEWIYTGKLRSMDYILSNVDITSSLYVFASHLSLTAAANSIIDSIRQKHHDDDDHYGAEEITTIYVKTACNSPLREYAMELFVYVFRAEEETLVSNDDVLSLFEIPPLKNDFLRVSRSISVEDPRESGCRFHIHGRNDVCEAKGDSKEDEDGDEEEEDEAEDEDEEDDDEAEDEDEDEDEEEEEVKEEAEDDAED
ncbi:hypothetical protein NHQ30_008942 [Ciborinia camelliae]|nr:hypothetical protein NHQ30_008942 [Ciborinia camelliae]